MEQEIFPYCQQRGIGVMAHASMGWGLLAGAYAEDHQFGEMDWRGRLNRLGGYMARTFSQGMRG